MTRRRGFLIILIITQAAWTFAQLDGEPISMGHSFSIHSERLGENRPYLVHLPRNYHSSTTPMVTMYLLDGQDHFLHTVGITSFLSSVDRIPPIMVVAIPNTSDRTRDLTPAFEKDPTQQQFYPSAGKADSMLAFITEELIPHIDGKYRTNDFRILVGHSFGGIFAVNAWLQNTNVFDAYLAISPSMWWDNQNLVDKAERFLDSKPPLEDFFYMTIANEGGEMLEGVKSLAALFAEKAPENFDWDFNLMEDEDHNSLIHRSIYDGLEAMFVDWYGAEMTDLFLSGGMESIHHHFRKMSQLLGDEATVTQKHLNQLGYDLMLEGRLSKALEAFQINAELHPTAYNVYDSMAEAYLKMSDTLSSIENYMESLIRHPGSKNGMKMLQELGVDYDPMSEVIQSSKRKLKKFAGVYEASFGRWELKIKNGELTLTTGSSIHDEVLLVFPDDRFLLRSENITFQMQFGEEGEVTGLEAQMGISQMAQAIKIE